MCACVHARACVCVCVRMHACTLSSLIVTLPIVNIANYLSITLFSTLFVWKLVSLAEHIGVSVAPPWPNLN